MNKNTEAKKMQQMKQQTKFEIDLCFEDKSIRNLEFEQIFYEAVDSTFSILGETSKEVLFRFLETKLKVKRSYIGQNPCAFENMVEGIFGQASPIVKIQLIRSLHNRIPSFKYKGANKDFSFSEYVEELRKHL